jgi:RsiW-degrading membrane proteinase PrsW (M82 family)
MKLAILSGLTLLFSVGAFVAGQNAWLPPGLGTLGVMLGLTVALKLAWTNASRASTSAARSRLTAVLSAAGLALATVAVVVALPRITKAAGLERFFVDVVAQFWTLALLTVAAGPARTLGWRTFAGAFLLGFLGLMGVARFVGRPVVVALGLHSVFAVGIWVPLTEELCKMIPVILLLGLVLRRPDKRPSALDLMLLGAWIGAGFAVNENATLGRGAFSLTTDPIVSIFFPSALKGSAFGWTVAQSGHLVHTALISLGAGMAFLYRKRWRRRWILVAAPIAAVLLEHCSQNAISTGSVNRLIGEMLLALSLNGYLCAALLISGVAYLMALEWRVVGANLTPGVWLRLSTGEASRRNSLLATAQAGAGVT